VAFGCTSEAGFHDSQHCDCWGNDEPVEGEEGERLGSMRVKDGVLCAGK